MEQENIEEKTKEEQFNMAMQLLKRIDKLLDFITDCSIKKDLPNWMSYLIAIKNLIAYKFDTKEKEKDSLFVNSINEMIPEFSEKMYFNTQLEKYFLKDNEEYENYSLLVNLLEAYQDFLLNCMDKRNMLSVHKGEESLF